MSKRHISIAVARAVADKALEWCLKDASKELLAGHQIIVAKKLIEGLLREDRQPRELNIISVMNSGGDGFTITRQDHVPVNAIVRTPENYVILPNAHPRKASLEISVNWRSIAINGIGFFSPAKGKPGYRFSPWNG